MNQTPHHDSPTSPSATSSNTSTQPYPSPRPGECSSCRPQRSDGCILYCTCSCHQRPLLFQAPQGHHSLAAMVQLLTLAQDPTGPPRHQGPRAFPLNIFSQGTHNRPCGQEKFHSETKRGAIHLLHGPNLRGVVWPTREKILCPQESAHCLSPSSTPWTPHHKAALNVNKPLTTLHGSSSSSSSNLMSTAKVTQTQSPPHSDSGTFSYTLAPSQPQPPPPPHRNAPQSPSSVSSSLIRRTESKANPSAMAP